MERMLTAERLVTAMNQVVSRPEMYEAFIHQWQKHSARLETDSLEPQAHDLIEHAARDALDALINAEEFHNRDGESSIPLEKLSEPAFLLDGDGKIDDLNDLAWQTYGLDTRESANALRLEFLDVVTPGDLVARCLAANTADGFTMARCFDPEDGVNSVALFTRAPHTTTDQVLMVVNTGQGAKISARFLTDGCDLSGQEHEVLSLFLVGHTLAEISKRRGRSLQTVRNQMRSIFDKTGCSTQSDLMRLSFSLSTLLKSLTPVMEEANRINRQVISFLRPDGRVVEAVVAGARQGRLVIALPSIFGHPLTPAIEEKLARAGIRMLCLMPPGMGGSDPAPEGTDEIDCMAGDIEALLGQLGEDDFILTGRASAAPSVFALCAILEHRISKAIIVSSIVPSEFVAGKAVASDWSHSLMTATMASTGIAWFILRSGRRLMRVIGPDRFLKRMYAKSPPDLAILDDQAVVDSIEDGVQVITAQGFDAGSRDITRSFRDWSGLVTDCPHRVILLHGQHDPNVPLEAIRSFAAHFPAQCALVEYAGGGLLNYSHCDEVIDRIGGRQEKQT